MAETDDINQRMLDIANAERDLLKKLADYEKANAHVFETVQNYQARLAELQDMKQEIRKALIEGKDFDLHKPADGLKVSITPVARVKVADLDQVEDKYKSVQTVVDDKKAKEYLKLFGEVPQGFEDDSYYRFNWKDERNEC